MQRINNADHIATYSDSTYPVGPDTSGEITYVHVPPLGPLSIIVIALSCMAVAAFIWCYLNPLVRKWHSRVTGKTTEDRTKQPALVSARSLFSLRSERTATTRTPPTTPQSSVGGRYGHGRPLPEMRIARPPRAVSLSRGPSLFSAGAGLPSLSSSSSSSTPSPPSSSPPLETPLRYAARPLLGGVPQVIIAPVEVGILRQTVESRTTPRKGGGCYDGRRADDEE